MTAYEEIKQILAREGKECPAIGTNANGEAFIIESGQNDSGEYYRVTTAQKNNWLRINTYYEDDTIEETYKK